VTNNLKNWPKAWSWINLYFALFIIVWGAWVRLSGSGAGCGEHWPLCNGDVIPTTTSIKTMIEFIHRLTSGIFGFTMLAMVYISFKSFAKNHPMRLMSILALILTFIEALIGAVLVKKGLVEQNASSMRAIVIALHLTNTLLLMASLLGCVFFSQTQGRELKKVRISNEERALFSVEAFMILFVVTSGAITALGNTLFPDSSLIAGMMKDFSANSHFLTRLRIYHPISAVVMGGIFFLLCRSMRSYKELQNICDACQGILVLAIAFGVINWLMMAPTWGALTHLFIANVLWLAFVWLFLKRRYVHTS
jgi:cytochrome c oxidase assembly protein subunit 15